MTSEIETRDIPPRRLLIKKTTCKHNGIGPAFAVAVRSVGKCYTASAGKMASMPMSVYLDWRESDCDMAVGCKVEGEVALSEGCEWLDLAGGPHAFASHFGPYDTLQESHAAIRKWCAENGRTLCGPCVEAYSTDPGLEPDSSKWQTDIYYPVETL